MGANAPAVLTRNPIAPKRLRAQSRNIDLGPRARLPLGIRLAQSRLEGQAGNLLADAGERQGELLVSSPLAKRGAGRRDSRAARSLIGHR
jgi:chorismate-pyruvate lyase